LSMSSASLMAQYSPRCRTRSRSSSRDKTMPTPHGQRPESAFENGVTSTAPLSEPVRESKLRGCRLGRAYLPYLNDSMLAGQCCHCPWVYWAMESTTDIACKAIVMIHSAVVPPQPMSRVKVPAIVMRDRGPVKPLC
jgi:hypothetical protein